MDAKGFLLHGCNSQGLCVVTVYTLTLGSERLPCSDNYSPYSSVGLASV